MSFTPYYPFLETPISSDEGTANEPKSDGPIQSPPWKIFTSLVPFKLKPVSKHEFPQYARRYFGTQGSTQGTTSGTSSNVPFRLPVAEGSRSRGSQTSPAEFVTAPSSPRAGSPPSGLKIFQGTQTEWPSSPPSLEADDAGGRDAGGRDARGVFEAVLALWPIRRLKSTKLSRLKKRQPSDAAETSVLRRIPCPQTSGSGPVLNRPSSEERPACEAANPYASFWQRRGLGRARRKISSKMRRFWRIASGRGTQNVSPGKRPLQFHGSWRCSSYSPNIVLEQNPYFLPLFNDIGLPSCILVLVSDIEENWYGTWRPRLDHFWKSAQFWIVEIGSYILLAPVMIPWEVCAILAISLERMWNAGRGMSRERVLVKLRDHTGWLASGGMIGIILGTCMAFTGGARQKR
ncbi:hypothetical protein L211DRAFT_852676 [Terfezia boudieri ATCC MYA-4762]|uniref:Uncharacterized protein n=1 Tax=Terfezia boudieri ATCC MYA-4762 TaxID=1051890 RepID=A0A3N4LBK9_9PEZI|nr:hypothetical protein L211DRAFT_852676 [Terfezia boudieri ATCC MYA-4762]